MVQKYGFDEFGMTFGPREDGVYCDIDDYTALERENEVLNRVIRIHLAVGQDENIFETDLEQAVWKLRKEKRDLIEKVGELEVLYAKAVADVVTKSRRVIELEERISDLLARRFESGKMVADAICKQQIAEEKAHALEAENAELRKRLEKEGA